MKDVIISLGANDVCRDYGHTFCDAQLDAIAEDINETLDYLTSNLPEDSGRIFLVGVPNILNFRAVMADQDHNTVYKSRGARTLSETECTTTATTARVSPARAKMTQTATMWDKRSSNRGRVILSGGDAHGHDSSTPARCWLWPVAVGAFNRAVRDQGLAISIRST